MNLTRTTLVPFALALVLPFASAACGGAHDAIAQHVDEHGPDVGEDVFEDMPAELGSATTELAETVTQLVKEIGELPAPGKIELKDVAPDLAAFQGKRGADFLAFAHDAKGKALAFQYVKIGVPEYDDFFRAAEETYAAAYQATQVLANAKRLASKALGTKIEPGPDFKNQVAAAIAKGGPPAQVEELKALDQIAKSLAKILPDMQAKISKLLAAGEALVAAAPSSITNPKVVAHIGKVKEGVTRSAHLIKASGGLLTNLAKDFSSFK